MSLLLKVPPPFSKPRRIISASTSLRRRWAVHELVWMLLTLAVSLYFAALLQACSSWRGVYFCLGGSAFFVWRLFRQGARMRLILRGRGRPSVKSLNNEISSVRATFWAGCICAVLGAIMIPKFIDLMSYSNGGATRGNLGALRSALSIYYGDSRGLYPPNLSQDFLSPKYITRVPNAAPVGRTRGGLWHEKHNRVVLGAVPTDTGGWLYNPKNGELSVNCTHEDTRGKIWASY